MLNGSSSQTTSNKTHMETVSYPADSPTAKLRLCNSLASPCLPHISLYTGGRVAIMPSPAYMPNIYITIYISSWGYQGYLILYQGSTDPLMF